MPKKQRSILILSLIFTLSACFGGGQLAPVVERQERARHIPNTHLVRRGETLYSIAWRYSKDFRGLASTNGIAYPYIIYPGQRLIIKSTAKVAPKSAKASNTTLTTSSRDKANKSVKKTTPNSDKASSPKAAAWDQKRYPFRWQWPAKGHLLRPYSSSSAVHKGIDIQGKLGEPVFAANSGKVVYAGTGLVGYGKLLIIKHDEHYLSAYGHNRRLLVKEGMMVKGGQQIAEFGDTGTDTVKLHFEVRRDGQPINPLRVLPQR